MFGIKSVSTVGIVRPILEFDPNKVLLLKNFFSVDGQFIGRIHVKNHVENR